MHINSLDISYGNANTISVMLLMMAMNATATKAMVMKTMVIAKGEGGCSELPGEALYPFLSNMPELCRIGCCMNHQRFIHIFTYQTSLLGEFSLFSEERKEKLFLDHGRENENLIVSCLHLQTNH